MIQIWKKENIRKSDLVQGRTWRPACSKLELFRSYFCWPWCLNTELRRRWDVAECLLLPKQVSMCSTQYSSYMLNCFIYVLYHLYCTLISNRIIITIRLFELLTNTVCYYVYYKWCILCLSRYSNRTISIQSWMNDRNVAEDCLILLT